MKIQRREFLITAVAGTAKVLSAGFENTDQIDKFLRSVHERLDS